LAGCQLRANAGVDVLELFVAIGVPRALRRLAVRLEAVAHLVQETCNHDMTHVVSLQPELAGQSSRALRRPPQRRLRITPRNGIEQRHEILDQSRIEKFRLLAATTAPPSALEGQCLGLRKILDPSGYRLVRQSRRSAHRGDPTAAKRERLRRRPQSPPALVERRTQQ